jgi:hypothetical protein
MYTHNNPPTTLVLFANTETAPITPENTPSRLRVAPKTSAALNPTKADRKDPALTAQNPPNAGKEEKNMNVDAF